MMTSQTLQTLQTLQTAQTTQTVQTSPEYQHIRKIFEVDVL